MSFYEDDDQEFQAFRMEMKLKDEAKSVLARKQSDIKDSKRFSIQKQCWQQLTSFQRYLGLQAADNLEAGPEDTLHCVLEDLTLASEQASGHTLCGDSRPTTKNPGDSAFFVSVDVEAWEFDQKIVTEIGISTLDTEDLLGVPPGSDGAGWAPMIRSRHFRILEHRRRINKVHVKGCAEDFNFGQSEWIREQDVLSRLQECFTPPLGRSDLPSDRLRKVVLVAHDAVGDKKYLTGLGFKLTQFISDTIDSADLYRAANRYLRQPALSTLLLQNGIAAKHLHNAGNDAYYTLRVAVTIAADRTFNKGTAKDWAIEKQSRIEEACKEATQKVCAEFAAWDTLEYDHFSNPEIIPSDQQLVGAMPELDKQKDTRLRKESQTTYRTNAAVQNNSSSWENEAPFAPVDTGSARGGQGKQVGRDQIEGSLGDRGRSRGRGRGRGRGQNQGRYRGQGSGRNRGRGSVQVLTEG
ncbi:MAG: Dom-3 Z [Chaenotheca gracillima]|nr:MAG: Dom-3 Z [Chaenotheca gracillima]